VAEFVEQDAEKKGSDKREFVERAGETRLLPPKEPKVGRKQQKSDMNSHINACDSGGAIRPFHKN
jgi:hypothetical protein